MLKMYWKEVLQSQKGLSLIEILVSLTILSIIIIPVSALFLQSANSIHTSETILDKTYIIQEHLEAITYYSSIYSLDEGIEKLNEEYDYNSTASNPSSNIYFYYKKIEDNYLSIELKPSSRDGLLSVVVGVTDHYPTETLDNYMETILHWEE